MIINRQVNVENKIVFSISRKLYQIKIYSLLHEKKEIQQHRNLKNNFYFAATSYCLYIG